MMEIPAVCAPDLLAKSDDGWVSTNATGILAHANPAAQRLLNRGRAALIGKPIFAWIVESERPRARAALRAVTPAHLQHIELQFRRADAAPFWAQVELYAFAETGAAEPALWWRIRDMTAFKMLEKQKQQFEFLATVGQQFCRIVDATGMPEKIVQLAVPAFADLAIIHLEDANGRLLHAQVAHVDGAKQSALAQVEQQYLANRAQADTSTLLPTHRRNFTIHVTREFLRDAAYDDAHFALLCALNLNSYISVPLKNQRRIYGAIGFGVAAERTFARDDLTCAEAFARSAAMAIENVGRMQDARTAIAEQEQTIDLILQTVQKQNQRLNTAVVHLEQQWQRLRMRNNKTADTLDMLGAHIEQLMQKCLDNFELVNQLQEWTALRNGTGKPDYALTNLSALLETLATARVPHAQLELDQAAVSLQVDRARIALAIGHVLDNASKYGAGGAIRVQLVSEPGPADDAPFVHLIVRDNGIGVPPDAQKQIFEPFYRAPNALTLNVAGNGLGLALCAEIVALHGGQIWVESEGNHQGSAFHLRLPARS